MDKDIEAVISADILDAADRLDVTRSNFAAAIRQCQMAGMTIYQMASTTGLTAQQVSDLINAWGLDT